MATKFHRAARDGFLDILRQATRKDTETTDEDGKTPMLWAAYFGNLDSLRILVQRGGDPDKPDLLGNTALHCAALNGHMHIVEFLVNFGANIWKLDNDHHSAIDLASLKNHMNIVQYLDTVIARQSATNAQMVRKLKDRAILEADRRRKEYERKQEKANRKAEKEDRILAETDGFTRPKSKSIFNTITMRLKGNKALSVPSDVKAYSEHINDEHNGGKMSVRSGVARKLQQKNNRQAGNQFKIGEVDSEGKRTVRSISGYKHDSEILYTKNVQDVPSNSSKDSGPTSPTRKPLNEVFDNLSIYNTQPHTNGVVRDSGVRDMDYASTSKDASASMFERPGFGNVAFLNRKIDGMLSLPNGGANEADDDDDGFDEDEKDEAIVNGRHRKPSETDSIGTVGSLAYRARNNTGATPWDEEDFSEDDECSPLELFLASHGLMEFIPKFNREKVDLEALMLLNDNDLKDLEVPLGPRRKILDAVARRKEVMEDPGFMVDTKL